MLNVLSCNVVVNKIIKYGFPTISNPKSIPNSLGFDFHLFLQFVGSQM
jgi:hypothetical protein